MVLVGQAEEADPGSGVGREGCAFRWSLFEVDALLSLPVLLIRSTVEVVIECCSTVSNKLWWLEEVLALLDVKNQS